MSSFKLTGTREVMRNISHIADSFPARVGAAIRTETESILESSQEVVPVDSGALKATGRVSDVNREGDDFSVEITYGSPEVDYAAAVHENLDVSGAGGKYLEQPLRRAKRGFPDRVADRLKV